MRKKYVVIACRASSTGELERNLNEGYEIKHSIAMHGDNGYIQYVLVDTKQEG